MEGSWEDANDLPRSLTFASVDVPSPGVPITGSPPPPPASPSNSIAAAVDDVGARAGEVAAAPAEQQEVTFDAYWVSLQFLSPI